MAKDKVRVYWGGDVIVPINKKHVFRLPRTFTIFCHGTGGHRDGKCNELITEFGGNCEGTYQTDYLILDGVGPSDMWKREEGADKTGKKPGDQGYKGAEEIGVAGSPHPMPGTFEPDAMDKPLKAKDKRLGGKKGGLKGYGWNDNVRHAIFVLKKLAEKDKFPERINMIGWSRGAVTCLKTANLIDLTFRDTQEFETNILAIDPVPGNLSKDVMEGVSPQDLAEDLGSGFRSTWGKKKYWDIYTLPRTLKRYVVFIALDEQREGFEPVDFSRISYPDDSPTKFVFLPFPGIHRTLLRLDPRDPADPGITCTLHTVGGAVAGHEQVTGRDIKEMLMDGGMPGRALSMIAWDLAYRFLKSLGTEFKEDWVSARGFDKPMDLYQVLENYTKVMDNRQVYHECRNRGAKQRAMGGFEPRKFTGFKWGSGLGSTHDPDGLYTDALGTYTLLFNYFLNEHHRQLFIKAFPLLYAAYFGNSQGSPPAAPAQNILDAGLLDYAVPDGVTPEETTATKLRAKSRRIHASLGRAHCLPHQEWEPPPEDISVEESSTEDSEE